LNRILSLTDLESFDNCATRGGTERRFCCPICGENKPRDTAHRSLSVNTNTGLWKCHRCSSDGQLREWWKKNDNDHFVSTRDRQRETIKARFQLKPRSAPLTPKPEVVQQLDRIHSRYKMFVEAFPNSLAAKYLVSRGIGEAIAVAAGCGYAAGWEHWEKQNNDWVLAGKDRRVVFPVRDRDGKLVRGTKSMGTFLTPCALESEMLCICEAPIDALTLASAGFPAIALMGTSWPAWLRQHCAFRRVGVAFDADSAGDSASDKLERELVTLGASVVRCRSIEAKDWNDALMVNGALLIKSQISSLLYPVVRCPECGDVPNVEEENGWIFRECPCGRYVSSERRQMVSIAV
jgi:DNA primase